MFTGPCEVLISDHRERELRELGLIALQQRMESDDPCFQSASTLHAPGTEIWADGGSRPGITSLPSLFLLCRLAAYLRVIWREQLAAGWLPEQIEQDLNRWLTQITVSSDGASSNQPFHRARVRVIKEPTSQGDWHLFHLTVVPHDQRPAIVLQGELEPGPGDAALEAAAPEPVPLEDDPRVEMIPVEQPQAGLWVGQIPDARIFQTHTLYLLVDLEHDWPGAFDTILDYIKVAALDEIVQVVKGELGGVPVVHDPAPPDAVPGSLSILTLRVDTSGSRWEALASYGTIAVYQPIDSDDVTVTLLAVAEQGPT